MGQGKIADLLIISLNDLAGTTGVRSMNSGYELTIGPTAKFSISAMETWDRFRLPLPNGNCLRGAGEPPRKLFLQPLSDLH